MSIAVSIWLVYRKLTHNKAQIYLSHIHDPYLNLGIEDWLFRQVLDQQPILLLWRNQPCVVIGRAQNPWLECNVNQLIQCNIPIVRRQSGGGTVYHDLGNLNISFLSPKPLYNKQQNLQVIKSALAGCGFTASISERHDILLHHQNQTFKISGSAFRETKDHAFHHASLLIDTNVENLWQALTPTISTAKNSKGVRSVRSPVITLKHVQPTLALAHIEQTIIQAFNEQHHVDPSISTITTDNCPLHAQRYSDMIQQWDWRFGRTLPFSVEWQPGVDLHIKQGKVLQVDCTSPEQQCHYQNLQGLAFDKVAVSTNFLYNNAQ